MSTVTIFVNVLNEVSDKDKKQIWEDKIMVYWQYSCLLILRYSTKMLFGLLIILKVTTKKVCNKCLLKNKI